MAQKVGGSTWNAAAVTLEGGASDGVKVTLVKADSTVRYEVRTSESASGV